MLSAAITLTASEAAQQGLFLLREILITPTPTAGVMNPDKLITPFIIYWDIDSSLSDDSIVLRVCDELIKSKIFVLNLRDISSSICAGTFAVLNSLRSEDIRIILTVQPSFFIKPNIKFLKGLRVRRIYIEVYSLQQLQSVIVGFKQGVAEECQAGVSFYINEKNFRDIPSIISLCSAHNIKHIQFPIQRVDGNRVHYPDPDSFGWLSDEIKKIPLARIDFSIHDPFLWELFYGSDNPKSDGCNGALTMMYISENFDVTPCPLIPITIGNLHSTDMKNIFLSEKRKEIRKSISVLPKECLECSALSKCKGGCRGRAYVLYSSFYYRDPACLIND